MGRTGQGPQGCGSCGCSQLYGVSAKPSFNTPGRQCLGGKGTGWVGQGGRKQSKVVGRSRHCSFRLWGLPGLTDLVQCPVPTVGAQRVSAGHYQTEGSSTPWR